jgi:hypothetical protein
MTAAVLAAAFGLLGTGSASADCRADLVATDQGISKSHEAVERAAAGSQAQKCAAWRQHVVAMVQARDVLGRCDTGRKRDEHAGKVTAAIADVEQRIKQGCKR